MRVGQSYLIFLGDWHVVAGRVAEQIGPNTYELEYASKVDIEGDGSEQHPYFGDRWQDLAAGDGEVRRGCRHWDYGTLVVPLNIMAMVWHGDLLHPDAPKTAVADKRKK